MNSDPEHGQVASGNSVTMQPGAEQPPTQTWNDLVAEALSTEDYSAALKAALPSAVSVVRRELGELDGQGPGGSDQRYWTILGNRAPWTRWFLVWLARVLDRAKGCRGYEEVRQRVASAGSVNEALELFETAELFLDARMCVEFEPRVEINGSPRRPDLLVTTPTGAERAYVEVKHLRDPRVMVESLEVTSQMAFAFMESQVHGGVYLERAGEWHRSPRDAEEVEAVAIQVRLTAERARATAQLAECKIGDLIEFAFAPPAAHAQLENWARARGFEVGSVLGPEFDPQEQRRLADAVSEKAGQLPREVPGLIFIRDQRLGMRGLVSSTATEGNTLVRQRLRRHPHLIGAVLWSREFFGRPLEAAEFGSWSTRILASRQLHVGRCLEYEFVQNDGYRRSVPRGILRGMYRAIRARHRRPLEPADS